MSKLPLFLSLPTILVVTGVASAQTTSVPVTASTSGSTRFIVQLDSAPPTQLAYWASRQQMHATATGSIAQLSLNTEMKVAPQAINPVSAMTSLTKNVPVVQVILTVPDLARTSRLDFGSIKINGQAIDLCDKWDTEPKIGPRYVHLFFDRSKIVSIIGPFTGQQVVTLQIAFAGGHLLVASDTLKLL